MRYKVRFGNNPDMYAVCYADSQVDAAAEFHRYHPNLTITFIEEFPVEKPVVDLYDLIDDCDSEKAIRHLIDAIDEIGATDRVAGYLRRHGFG